MVMIIMLEVDCNIGIVIRKYPTVVCDFTRHEIELFQTSPLLGDDFHAPTERHRNRANV